MYIKFIENIKFVLNTYNEDKLLCPNSVSNAMSVLSPIMCSCLLLDMGKLGICHRYSIIGIIDGQYLYSTAYLLLHILNFLIVGSSV